MHHELVHGAAWVPSSAPLPDTVDVPEDTPTLIRLQGVPTVGGSALTYEVTADPAYGALSWWYLRPGSVGLYSLHRYCSFTLSNGSDV